MSTLSPSQRLILATAAARGDGAVLPLPDELARRGRTLMLKSLLGRGLIVARPAQDGEPAWSGGADEQDQALAITPAGRALSDAERQAPAPRMRGRRKTRGRRPRVAAAPDAGQAAAPIRPGTKQALLVALLGRPEGASIGEIQAATGWQPHSARAALTGLKHKGLALTSARRADGTRAYHRAPEAAAAAQDQAH